MKKVFFLGVFILLTYLNANSQTGVVTYSGNHPTQNLSLGLWDYYTSGSTVGENVWIGLGSDAGVTETEMEVWSEGRGSYGDNTYFNESSYTKGTIWLNEGFYYDTTQISVLHYVWYVYYTDGTYEEYDYTVTY